MLEHLGSFLSVFVTNILYTYYIKAVNKDKHLLASIWSASISLVASTTVLFYIDNHWTLISVGLGAFFGTLVGMKVKRSNESSDK